MKRMPCLIVAAFAALTSAAERPKYIAFAWEFSGNTPQSLLRIVDKFDQTPLDGIGLWLKGSAVVNLAVTNSVTVTNGYKTVALAGVKGGEYYGIAFAAKGASAKVNVFFRDANNKYVHPSLNLVYPDDGRGVVRVPEGGVRGVIVFEAINGPGGKTVFDDIRVYRLSREVVAPPDKRDAT